MTTLAVRSPVQLFPAGVKGQSVAQCLVLHVRVAWTKLVSCMELGSFGGLHESPPPLLESVHQKPEPHFTSKAGS